MNTTELRDELSARAASIDAPPTMSTGVAGKIRATKRRRAGAVAGAACAVAVLTGVTVVNGGRSTAPVVPAGRATPSVMVASDGMPYRAVPPAPGDVVRDGLRYRAQVADDRLAVAAIGAVGQGKVTMTWTPTSTHVSLATECWLPGADTQSVPLETAFLLIDGKRLVGSSCAPHPASPGALPAGGAFTVGKPVTVTVEAFDRNGKPVTDPRVRVSGAVYVQGPQRNVTDESTGQAVAEVPEVTEYEGYRYRLTSLTTKPATGGPPTAATPSQTPFLVTYGSAGLDPAGGTAGDVGRDYLVGLDTATGGNSGGIIETVPQPARAAGTLTLRHEGAKPKRGVQHKRVAASAKVGRRVKPRESHRSEQPTQLSGWLRVITLWSRTIGSVV